MTDSFFIFLSEFFRPAVLRAAQFREHENRPRGRLPPAAHAGIIGPFRNAKGNIMCNAANTAIGLKIGVLLGVAIVAIGSFAVAARAADQEQKGRSVTQQQFGKTADGIGTTLFTCTNANGVRLQVTDYGARIVAVDVPDMAGKVGNVTLGFDSAEKYAAHSAFFGCTTGRFANRIAKGRFTLDGKEYKLATNGENHLHGGK